MGGLVRTLRVCTSGRYVYVHQDVTCMYIRTLRVCTSGHLKHSGPLVPRQKPTFMAKILKRCIYSALL